MEMPDRGSQAGVGISERVPELRHAHMPGGKLEGTAYESVLLALLEGLRCCFNLCGTAEDKHAVC